MGWLKVGGGGVCVGGGGGGKGLFGLDCDFQTY